MRLTQGTFSYLADLTDAEIAAQVRYCLAKGWAVNIEHTDDAHPRNVYWDMWELPYFDQPEPSGIMLAIEQCRMAFPDHYIRVNGYDRSYGRQTTALSFIVQRPAEEPGFRLIRQEGTDRQIRYTLQPYAADKPAGQRYKTNGNGRAHNGSGWQFAAHPEPTD